MGGLRGGGMRGVKDVSRVFLERFERRNNIQISQRSKCEDKISILTC